MNHTTGDLSGVGSNGPMTSSGAARYASTKSLSLSWWNEFMGAFFADGNSDHCSKAGK